MARPMYLRTIDDFARVYGGMEWAQQIFKADDPMLTTTTGVYAPHYGAKIWAQLNMEYNLFAILPKFPWGPEDGWTVISAFPSTKVFGVAENGAIPDSVKPEFVKLYEKPKAEITQSEKLEKVEQPKEAESLEKNGEPEKCQEPVESPLSPVPTSL